MVCACGRCAFRGADGAGRLGSASALRSAGTLCYVCSGSRYAGSYCCSSACRTAAAAAKSLRRNAGVARSDCKQVLCESRSLRKPVYSGPLVFALVGTALRC